MNTHPHLRARESGFTLTEIALCIAVIAIALTAIIGVLPSGLNVQRQNREDTLVAQDAQFLLESIRSGAMAIPDLTNNVDFVLWRRRGAENSEIYFRGPNFGEPLPGTVIPLTASWQVTALMTTPRFEVTRDGGLIENEIVAQFRSLSSPFTEKAYRSGTGLPDQTRLATAFRYLVSTENQGGPTRPPLILAGYTNQAVSNVVASQTFRIDSGLSELRLTFQWPVFRAGAEFRTGNNRKAFRALVRRDYDLLTTNLLGTLRPAMRFNAGRTNALPSFN